MMRKGDGVLIGMGQSTGDGSVGRYMVETQIESRAGMGMGMGTRARARVIRREKKGNIVVA